MRLRAVLEQRPDLLPSVGVAFSGAMWGLFWLPMRLVDDAGLDGGWGAVAFFLPGLVLLTPVAAWRRRRLAAGGVGLLITGLFTGASFALYAISLVLTEVVRSLLLFYVTPVWSTLLARVLIGERVTAGRGLALTLGMLGLWVILGAQSGWPAPRNAGDWLALLSGIAWAYGSLRVYAERESPAFETLYAFFLVGTVVTAAVLLGPLHTLSPPPTVDGLEPRAAWVSIVSLAVMGPTLFVILWGASRLSPARVGLLLMLEVVVGIGSAALWAGEPFGAREAVGAALVLAAGVVDVAHHRPATATRGAAP